MENKIFKNVLLLSLSVFIILGLNPVPVKADNEVIQNKESNYELRPELEERLPLYAGYYRTWHDLFSIGVDGKSNGGKVQMDKIPEDVDLVFVFDDWQHKESPYYEKLKNEYVPKMQKRGQMIIRTIGTEFLYGATGIAKNKLDYYTNDDEGYQKLAKDLVESYVLDFNLDGLDIDVEAHNYSLNFISKEQRERIHGVLSALGTLIGPNGEYSDKLFIYDTTLGPDNQAFLENYQNFDLVLLQRYGISGERGKPNFDGTYTDDLEETFQKFSKYISPKKIMIGFSNYEENSTSSNRWYDIPMTDGTVQKINENNKVVYEKGNLEHSRAGRYARWQPSMGVKGGIFVYAIERDDVLHPTRDKEGTEASGIVQTDSDQKLSTEFRQSRELIAIQNKTGDYDKIDHKDFPDEYFRNLVQGQIGHFKGELARFSGDLMIDDHRIKDLKGLELLKNANVKIKNLDEVEELDLSGRGLEDLHLEFDASKSKLKKLDISHNALDLSKGTKNREVFDELASIVIKNNDGLSDETVLSFSGQKIKSYYPANLDVETLDLDIQEGEYFNLDKVLGKTITAQKTDISTKEQFNEVKNEKIFDRKFLDDRVSFESLRKDYSEFKVEGWTSTRRRVDSKRIELDYAESYELMLTDDHRSYPIQIHVGGRKEMLDNLALGADYPFNQDYTQLADIFDGSLSSSATLAFSTGFNYIFDIGEDAEVSLIRLYNASANKRDIPRPENDLEKMRFEAFIGDKDIDNMSEREKEIYLNEDENWVEVVRSEEALEVWEGDFSPVRSRFWRWHVDTVRGNKTMYSFPMATELEFIGTREKKSKVIGPVDPFETENPNEKEYWTIEFLAGEHGKIAKENTYYIFKDEDLRFSDLELPQIETEDGFVHLSWSVDLETNIKDNTKVWAQYRELDSHKYKIKVEEIVKNFGQKITEKDIKNAIHIEDYFKDFTMEYSLEEDIKNGILSGDFELEVSVRFEDASSAQISIPIKILEKVDKSKLEVIIDEAKQKLLSNEYSESSKANLKHSLSQGELILVDEGSKEYDVKKSILDIKNSISNLSLKKPPKLEGLNKQILIKDCENDVILSFAHSIKNFKEMDLEGHPLVENEDYFLDLETNKISLSSKIINQILEKSDEVSQTIRLSFENGPEIKEGTIYFTLETLETLEPNTKYVSDANLEFGETKVIKIGDKTEIDHEKQEVISSKNDTIIAIGNIEYGEKIKSKLPNIIVKTDKIKEGQYEIIKGSPEIKRYKTIFSVDPNTGNLINPKIEKELIDEGTPTVFRIGTGPVKKHVFETKVIENKTIYQLLSNKPLGNVSIKRKGKKGLTTHRYEVSIRGGKETNRILDILYKDDGDIDPVDEIIHIGTDSSDYERQITTFKQKLMKLNTKERDKIASEIENIERNLFETLSNFLDTDRLSSLKLDQARTEIIKIENDLDSIERKINRALEMKEEKKDQKSFDKNVSFVNSPNENITLNYLKKDIENDSLTMSDFVSKNNDHVSKENIESKDKDLDTENIQKEKSEEKKTLSKDEKSDTKTIEKKDKGLKNENKQDKEKSIPVIISILLLLFLIVYALFKNQSKD